MERGSYSEFLAFVSMEGKEALRNVLFDCIAFYQMVGYEPYYEAPKSIYRLGEWLQGGARDKAFEVMDAVQHAAHEAVEEFRDGALGPGCWMLDTFEEYLMFSKVCNQLEHVTLRGDSMEFASWYERIHPEEEENVER